MSSSTFPPPPRFYRLYGGKEGDPLVSEEEEKGKRTYQTFPEPPTPPLGEEFEAFGWIYTLQGGLPPLRTERVLFEVNEGRVEFKKELLRLNKEILFHYIELIDTLVQRPERYPEALADLEALFHNVHYLLNAMRHVQARYTFQQALEDRASHCERAIQDIRNTREHHRKKILMALQSLSNPPRMEEEDVHRTSMEED